MTLAADFAARGFAIWRGFYDPARIADLRAAADAVLERWRAGNMPDRFTNIAFLTEPRWHRGHGTLLPILRAAADPRALQAMVTLGHGAPLFHNTQYFTDWPQPARNGDWHRDTQFLAKDAAEERTWIFGAPSVHFRIALVDDDSLDYVPGSERRWDEADEAAARAGRGEPADFTRIALRAGDACLFHAWGVHRGRYGARPRRTFDTIYMLGAPCAFHTPPPTCFQDAAVMAALSPNERTFFDRFVAAYRDRWIRG